MVGPWIDRQIDTRVRNAVTLVWGSLRLAPISNILAALYENLSNFVHMRTCSLVPRPIIGLGMRLVHTSEIAS